MNESTRDRRILVLALVAVLALRLLAWTGGETGLVHAGQTIPTRTPTGQPVTPATVAPSRTPAPGKPTEGPAPATAVPTATSPQPTSAGPSATPLPGMSPSPLASSPVPGTAAPTSGTLPPTDGPGASPMASGAPAVESATAGPGEPTAAPLPTATRTSQPPAPSATPEPLPTPLLVGDEPQGAAMGSSQGETVGRADVLLSPCLWIGLGLLLMVAGAAILLTRRRAL